MARQRYPNGFLAYIYFNHPEVFKVTHKGVGVYKKDKYGVDVETPVHYLIKNKETGDIILFFVEHYSDLDPPSESVTVMKKLPNKALKEPWISVNVRTAGGSPIPVRLYRI